MLKRREGKNNLWEHNILVSRKYFFFFQIIREETRDRTTTKRWKWILIRWNRFTPDAFRWMSFANTESIPTKEKGRKEIKKKIKKEKGTRITAENNKSVPVEGNNAGEERQAERKRLRCSTTKDSSGDQRGLKTLAEDSIEQKNATRDL